MAPTDTVVVPLPPWMVSELLGWAKSVRSKVEFRLLSRAMPVVGGLSSSNWAEALAGSLKITSVAEPVLVIGSRLV